MTTYESPVRKNTWPTWVLLLLGLITTAAIAVHVKYDIDSEAKKEFDFSCRQTLLRINARMKQHAQILMSAAALFGASDGVTREKWHAFIQQQNIEQIFPGIQGVAFAPVVSREQLSRHIQEIRSQGFPDYRIKPEGDREIYCPVIWLEPFTERNVRVLGYDTFSESVRRAAMEQARDMNAPVLSGKVFLSQETTQDLQAGSLMYLPMYHKGMQTDTVSDRRTAIYGWVFTPYRMKDLMQGILGGWNAEAGKRIRLQIYDNEQDSGDSLLYDSQPDQKTETAHASGLTWQTPETFYGHTWNIRFTQMENQTAYTPVYGILSAGTVISLLLFGFILSLQNTRFKAQSLADQLTRDIREAEESLHRVMREQQIILETAHVGICLIADRKILWVNQRTADILQYSKEEIVGQPTQKFYFSEEMSEQAGNDAYQVITQGQIYDGELKMARRDGMPVWVRTTGKAVEPLDLSKGTIWLIEDITERRQAEKALQASRKLLSDLIDFLPDATLAINNEGRVIIWNKAIEKMTGIPAEEMIGKSGHAYAVPFYGEARPILIDYVLKDNETIVDRYPGIIRKSNAAITEAYADALYHGKGAWIIAKASSLYDPSGNITGAIQIIRDISVRKTAETELQEINRTLEDRVAQEVQRNMEQERMLIHQSRMAAMGEMISNIAHQWRQPLNALSLLIFNIKDAFEYNDLDEAFINQAVADGNRLIQNMSSTISDFQNFFSPNKETKAFSALEQIREAVKLVQSSFDHNNISVHVDAPFDLMLSGFPNEFSQVLLNLLSNAKDAIRSHHLALSGRVEIILTEEGNQKLILVRDNGGGIPEDIRNRIFDPYFSTKGKGSGIGLYMSKMIIERNMNGSITAVNIEDGAEFRVCIPLAEDNACHPS